MDNRNVALQKMEYYSAAKTREIMKYVGKWVDLEIIIFKETPNGKYCKFPFMCGWQFLSKRVLFNVNIHRG